MCCGAILLSRIQQVYYGASDLNGGTAGPLMTLLQDFFRALRKERKENSRKHLREHMQEENKG